MYAIIPQQIPQDRRAEINEKILFAIDSGKDLVPKESIYNCDARTVEEFKRNYLLRTGGKKG